MSSRKTTGRVDSSQITSFLCFTCGDTFGNHLDYHRHLMEHQAVSLIYQLYYLEHEYQNNPDAKAAGKLSSSSASAAASRRNTEPTKRLISTAIRRPIRYSDDNELKEEAKKKDNRQIIAMETVKRAEKSVRRASFKDIGSPSKKPKFPPNDIPSQLRFAEREGYLEMKTHEMFCDLCPNNPSFAYPLEALSHWVKDHDADIVKNEIQFLARGTSLTHTGKAAGEECPTCKIRFESPAEGHLHFLEKHLAEVIEVLILKLHVPTPIDELIINSTVALPFQKESIIRISTNVVLKC